MMDEISPAIHRHEIINAYVSIDYNIWVMYHIIWNNEQATQHHILLLIFRIPISHQACGVAWHSIHPDVDAVCVDASDE